jgi:hypothetical protein
MTVDQLQIPLARNTDPETSRLAANAARRSRKELVAEIERQVLWHGPGTHEQIAGWVQAARPGVWPHTPSIVTACSAVRLHEVDKVRNSRNRLVVVWALRAREDGGGATDATRG